MIIHIKCSNNKSKNDSNKNTAKKIFKLVNKVIKEITDITADTIKNIDIDDNTVVDNDNNATNIKNMQNIVIQDDKISIYELSTNLVSLNIIINNWFKNALKCSIHTLIIYKNKNDIITNDAIIQILKENFNTISIYTFIHENDMNNKVSKYTYSGTNAGVQKSISIHSIIIKDNN